MAEKREAGSRRKGAVFALCLILLLGILGSALAYIIKETPTLENIFRPSPDATALLSLQTRLEHPLGDGYDVPEDLKFHYEIDFGPEYANKPIHTGLGDYVADENGVIDVLLSPESVLHIPFLPEGTKVKVSAISDLPGFRLEGDPIRELTLLPDGVHLLDFLWIYEPAAASLARLSLEGEKKLLGREWQPGDSFDFLLEYRRVGDADDSWISLGTKNVSYSLASPADFNLFSFSDVLDALELSQVGTYAFRLREQEGSQGGIQYDSRVAYFDVLVGDADMDGHLELQDVQSSSSTLSLSKSGADYLLEVLIENSYAPHGGAAVELRISKTLEDLSGQGLTPTGFSFELYNADDSLNKVSDPSSAAGECSMLLLYSAADAGKSYHYTLKEKNSGLSIDGLHYDSREYKLRVSLVDNLDGAIRAYVYLDEGLVDPPIPADAGSIFEADFVNRYQPEELKLSLGGEKSLSGRALQDGEFSFLLYEADPFGLPLSEAALQQVANDAAGEFHFAPLSFTKVGTYNYLIKEDASAALPGVIYDTQSYQLRVQVEDDGGVLQATTRLTNSLGETAEKMQFSNRYRPVKVQLQLGGKKLLQGRALAAEEFSFLLFESDSDFKYDGDPLQSVKNGADGSFLFAPISYEAVGKHYYVLKEKQDPAMRGVDFDDAEYYITVDVTDSGSGDLQLQTEFVVARGSSLRTVEEISFENAYKAEAASLQLQGRKYLEGASLKDGMFFFELFEADTDFRAQGSAIDRVSNDASGIFRFAALNFTEPGIHYYRIEEDSSAALPGLSYDPRSYGLLVELTDSGSGQLLLKQQLVEISESGEETAAEGIIFRNAFLPAEDEAELELYAKKIVRNMGTDEIGPKGFSFRLVNISTGAKYEAVSDRDGLASFTLHFAADEVGKRYSYRMTEIDDGQPHVEYSQEIYEFQVEILAGADGSPLPQLLYSGEQLSSLIASFENIYTHNIQIVDPILPDEEDPEIEPDPGVQPDPGIQPDPGVQPDPGIQPDQERPEDKPGSPQTGDSSRIVFHLVLAAVSGAALLLLFHLGRKRKQARR